EFELQQLESILRLSADDFKAHARTLSSPDELSVYIARQLMRHLAPSLLWITMHDIDVAHAGAYSMYIEGIQRTDRLCAELWHAIQTEPEYAGKTTLMILPDFGRDADEDAGGNGFQHHRTGDALSRTTWMLAIGHGIREGIVYDFKFPAERHALDRELANLGSLSPAQIGEWFQGFAKISVSTQLERSDWINSPAQFVEQLSAHLWTTHQLDAFRVAATEYADRLHAAVTPQPPPVPRLGITVIGQGVSSYDGTLFGKLRPHGGYFTHINPENGLRLLLDAVGGRAKAHSSAYGHWYIDGG